MTLDELTTVWIQAKEAERVAIDLRRSIEDEIKATIGVPEDLEGTMTEGQIKITGRIDRKVDADKLQELAEAAGLATHLRSLFRWKPEINQAAWKAADESITRPLLSAITSKPGRPSFALSTKKEG